MPEVRFPYVLLLVPSTLVFGFELVLIFAKELGVGWVNGHGMAVYALPLLALIFFCSSLVLWGLVRVFEMHRKSDVGLTLVQRMCTAVGLLYFASILWAFTR
jgi:hypothetical protein